MNFIDRIDLAREFHESVAHAAGKYHGRPYRKVDHSKAADVSDVELGTDPDKGFDCSGLVIRSICDALGRRPRDTWRPEYRSAQGIREAVFDGSMDDYSRIRFSEVLPGDVILWTDGGEKAEHCAIATHILGSPSAGVSVPYTHATYRGDEGVRSDLLFYASANSYLIPLGNLVQRAIKLDDD